MKQDNFPLSVIEKYCLTCGTPPLLVGEEAEKIHRLLHNIPGSVISEKSLEKNLARLPRFRSNWEFNTWIRMNYQDFVWIHHERMLQLVRSLEDEFKQLWIDTNILQFLCKYHDSSEGISVVWDIPTPIKEGLSWEIKNIHIAYEQSIIKTLAEDILISETYWLNPYERHEHLHACIEKEELVHQILSYLDKFDGFMVVLHEVLSWNPRYFIKIMKRYIEIFWDIAKGERLPLLQEFIKTLDPETSIWKIFSPEMPQQVWKAKVDHQPPKNTFHTSKSIEESFWVEGYRIWKDATKNIQEVQIWGTTMNGEQLLIERQRQY